MVNHPRRSRKAAVAVARQPGHDHDADYAMLLHRVEASFNIASPAPMFATGAVGLFDLYLSHLGSERDIHSCSACRRFIEHYGALVTINAEGHAASVMWNASVPEFYQDAVRAMHAAVSRARVTGQFLASEPIWGTPKTGTWTHFAVSSPAVYRNPLLTPGQAMAAKREDFITVARALSDFTPDMLGEALRLLEAAHLARSERFISPVRWLLDLQTKRKMAKDARVRDNLLWLAVATAPEGYCHPRSSMIGSLLEDIAAGLPFADVKARFDSKMHPLQYQRPQAAPTAGNLKEAEKIVEKLGIAPALERRFARLDEVKTIWTPAAPKDAVKPTGGVFAHLSPKGAEPVRPLDAPAATMTWDKFARTILPTAEAIDVAIAHGRMNFIATTTAVHADAPPIFKWDREVARYPVAHYVYNGGSTPERWGLSAGWHRVTAVSELPSMEGGLVLVVAGCADTGSGQGNALFPECLRDELRAVRATIEAYSRAAELTGRDAATANGLAVSKNAKQIGYTLRVTASGRTTDYQIDRWD